MPNRFQVVYVASFVATTLFLLVLTEFVKAQLHARGIYVSDLILLGTGTSSTSTAASRTSVTYERAVSIAQETLVRPENSHDSTSTEHNAAFATFLDEYPEYRQTWIIDSLRRSDYARLSRTEETYVDHMGGALSPETPLAHFVP